MVPVRPLLLSATALASLLIGACRTERIIAPPDTTPPQLQILSPIDANYDADGDHFVDLSVQWNDAGTIDTASVEVFSLDPISGTATATTNLRMVWRVAQLDSLGLVLQETIDNLLPDGLNRLVVSVRDTAGNETVDTAVFTLPPIVYHDSIITGITSSSGVSNTRSIVIDQAGRRGYAGVASRIIVFDPDSLTVIANVSSGSSFQVQRILLDEARGMAYITDGTLQRMDLATLSIVGPMTGAFAYAAIAYSRTASPLMYAGGSEVVSRSS